MSSEAIAAVLEGERAWHIELGHVMEVLRALPADSVHCVVTSPPYWGLRAYGTQPQVWGGDDPGCVHEWGREGRKGGGAHAHTASSQATGRGQIASHETIAQASTGVVCGRCGAWRGELGLEPSVELFVCHLVDVFREVRRVLRPDGVCWVNLGDSYAGSGRGPSEGLNKTNGHSHDAAESMKRAGGFHAPILEAGAAGRAWSPVPPGLKAKDLVGIPWRVAFALQDDGWWLRSDVVWSKPNPMPESVTDRPTRSHEYLFLVTKSRRYAYDADAIREPQKSLGERHEGKSGYREGHPSRQHIPSGWDTADGAHDTIPEGRYQHGYSYDHRELNPLGANKRSVWEIAAEPFPEAHFATYPTALVEPCIRAGTSARGCCPTCGAPWRRIAAKHFEPQADVSVAKGRRGADAQKPLDASNGWQGFPRGTTVTETTGWAPSCKCPAHEPMPCLVLDPFSGAGTTVLVANRLGRRGLGIELNPEYAAMAARRIAEDAPLLAAEPVELRVAEQAALGWEG